MPTFWFELLYLLVAWGLAAYSKSATAGLDPKTIMLSALFFTVYFCLPLMKKESNYFNWH